MKTITFILSLVSLSLTVASVSAAQNNHSNEIVQLPTFRVEASRYTDAEQKIENSLAELRSKASTPAAVKVNTTIDPNGSVAKAKAAKDAMDAKHLAAMTLRRVTRS